jgi:hypothetical protein
LWEIILEEKYVEYLMNNQIESFIQGICEEFSLPRDRVQSVWERVVGNSGVEESKSETDSGYTDAELRKMTVVMLKKILKDQGKRLSGKKDELISRILGESTEAPARQTLTGTKKTKKVSAKKRDETTLGRIYEASRPKVTVRPNSFGNHEHPDTGLVFRGVPPLVYGRQLPDGEIEPLSEETIDLCNQYKFKFEPPVDLAAASQAEDVEAAVDTEIADVEAAIRDLGTEDSEDELEDDGGIL